MKEEQKKEKERSKLLEKITNIPEREELEKRFDLDRAKVKTRMKQVVKRQAEELSKLESALQHLTAA